MSRALLGHYDLSGALFDYPSVAGLAATASAAGIAGADWRVGLGRWEAATRLLPSLTSGTPCPIPTPSAAASAGASDLDLIASRDWFSDDGEPVTLADTADGSRYALGYARSALDAALAFGARPFLSVDAMPRALAVNRTPLRDDCLWTFRNRVSNVRPADASVFAAALVGAVERLRLGSGGEPGRAFTHVELWNEPELPFFWDRSFEDGSGELDRFFEMALTALVALDAWRSASPAPEVKALRFGLAGFASASTAAQVIAALDATPLPGGEHAPLDFVSLHAYHDDPLAIAAAVDAVRSARDASAHYAAVELVLSEWGPDLDAHASDPAYAASIAPALHAASVVAEAASRGVLRAHRAILWDFYPNEIVTLGLASHDGAPKPLAHAYALLGRAIGAGDGWLHRAPQVDPPLPADVSALVTEDGAGRLRLLFVNRGDRKHRIRVEIDGARPLPSAVFVLDDPAAAARAVKAKRKVRLPPCSIVVAEY